MANKKTINILVKKIKNRISEEDTPLLELRNLNKTFTSGKSIVRANKDISFKINKSEVVGLIGESGSGKTTVGRTIMNLHSPESGSILLDGKEIGGKKLTRSQKKYLYNNVQMIFQDPYSSLNEQKNIMSIVSESLKAKGLDKRAYNELTHNEDEVLYYFQNELKEAYTEKYWEYRAFANATASSYFAKIKKGLENLKISNKKDMKTNYDILASVDFDLKEEANHKIISKLDRLIDFTIKEWKEKQKILANSDFSYDDEKKLHNNKTKLLKLKLEAGKTSDMLKLEAEINELNALKRKYIEFNETSINDSKSKYKSILKNFKYEKTLLKNSRAETTTLEGYNFVTYKIEILDSKILVAKKMIADKMVFPIIALFNEIEVVYKTIREVPSDKIFKERYINEINIYSIYTQIKVDKNQQNIAAIELSELSVYISNLQTEFLNLKKNTKETTLSNDLEEIEKLKEIISGDEDEFKKQLSIYEDESKLILKEMNKKGRENSDKSEIELNKWRDAINLLEKKLIGDILSLEKYNNVKFKTIKLARRNIKNIYKKSISSNKKLELEIKVNMTSLKTIKQLYGIGDGVHVLFKRVKLKNVFLRQEVFDTLEKVGLNKAASYRYPHEFSGGMRQRVGIARALISKPKLIIADEPIAALDLSIQAQIVNLLLDLKEKEGISLLFIAHDLSMVEHNSDRVLIMHLGRIVEYGNTLSIFNHPKHPYTKNLMSSIPSFEDLNKPFVDMKFESLYLKEYKGFNNPIYHKISKDHFVLATEKQIIKWKK